MKEKSNIYGVVYKAINIRTGKVYVGATTQPLTVRRKAHFYCANRYSVNGVWRRALKKFGEKNFVWVKLDSANSQKELQNKELAWLHKLRATEKRFGYNTVLGSWVKKSHKIKRPKISFELPTKTLALVKKYAKENDRSIAYVLRLALQKGLKKAKAA